MREEIAAAVVFVTRLVKIHDSIPKEKVEEFSSKLSAILIEKFRNHWYADEPAKGQGYRCIRINSSGPSDPVLSRAASNCGLQYSDLNLPNELTLWVDPKEVCCRFGESQSSFCQLAVAKDGNLENQAHTVKIEDFLEQQQRQFSMNLNIVTTRTSATKLKALAMKNAAFQHQQKSSYHYNNKYQQNLYNNNQQQQPNTSFSSTRPFQKSHKKGNFHPSGQSAGSMNNGGYGYQGTRPNGQPGNSATTYDSNFNSQHQNKDRFHWVKYKQSPPLEQMESMRLSPN